MQFWPLPLQLQPPLEIPPTTPLPTPSSATETSPAWDPSSRTPRPMTPAYLPQDNHWLEDVALMRVRIKVRSLEDGPGGNDLEVVSTEMGRVKVRDGMRMRTVTFDSLVPLRPTSLEELVTPISGERKGTIFKVKQIADGQCSLRIPGARERKKMPDPRFSISDLVQVFPSSR